MKNCASYLGQRISLLSHAGVRYEGVLEGIDPEEETVELREVRSMGTEGRQCEYAFPPCPSVYQYILFRCQDVADLQPQTSPPASPTKDFDFEAANALLIRPPCDLPPKSAYNKKSSFFDTISTSVAAVRPRGKGGRKVDVETFGGERVLEALRRGGMKGGRRGRGRLPVGRASN